ncbi:glycosyltransferase [Pseudomarimonas salicorniae]|uniref:Glycosyltransferase n=1 Tax=Pseudomarimonas salicorniae TaxID=2933270 RepID=A0ABT0GJ03_9GAMM|nr:glycosyltransferase [Lysobacter sp. CAU 1642]MCK7593985.1 glycosyltransferase [Lysobacter sp. CAU 1642]
MPEQDVSATGRPLSLLLLLEAHFPSMGGAERQLETLAGGLVERGHQVTVVLPRLDAAHPAGAGEHAGLTLWRIGYPRIPLLGSLLLQLRLALLLWRWRGRYDAIHVHIAHNMGAVAALVGHLLGKPVVLKFSGWWEAEQGCLRRGAGPLPALARVLLRRASAVQAISRRIGQDLVAAGFDPVRIHWTPNGVRTARFEALPRPRPITDGIRRVVFVGRLVPEKSLDAVLEAWQRAGMAAAGWRLRLVGGGPEEAVLRAQAERLGIGQSLEWVGPSQDVPRHLAEADAGILASRTEGLSNTLLEYMAAGLPVVATRISGSEDFVEPGRNGWLCAPGDVDGLAACLADCAAQSDQARAVLGANARADLLTRAALPAVIDALLPLYRGQPGGAR